MRSEKRNNNITKKQEVAYRPNTLFNTFRVIKTYPISLITYIYGIEFTRSINERAFKSGIKAQNNGVNP